MNKIKVEYLNHYMDDLWVVNIARVSMGKWHQEFEGMNDTRLINYLAEHEHWMPFAHPRMTFRITAPIFLARQLQKHQVGFEWSEISRRYVDTPPEFYVPEARRRAPQVKQGSLKEVVTEVPVIDHFNGNEYLMPPTMLFEAKYQDALDAYNALLAGDVAPEIARAVLPQGMMTQWIWTGSLYGFARVCRLRLDSHAQREAGIVASEIRNHMKRLFPVSESALLRNI